LGAYAPFGLFGPSRKFRTPHSTIRNGLGFPNDRRPGRPPGRNHQPLQKPPRPSSTRTTTIHLRRPHPPQSLRPQTLPVPPGQTKHQSQPHRPPQIQRTPPRPPPRRRTTKTQRRTSHPLLNHITQPRPRRGKNPADLRHPNNPRPKIHPRTNLQNHHRFHPLYQRPNRKGPP